MKSDAPFPMPVGPMAQSQRAIKGLSLYTNVQLESKRILDALRCVKTLPCVVLATALLTDQL